MNFVIGAVMFFVGVLYAKRRYSTVRQVVLIDSGDPAQGLTAEQLNALGIRNDIVRFEFGDRHIDASVWSVIGMNATRGESGDSIRFSKGVAQELGFQIGDDVKRVGLIKHVSP